MYIYVISIGSDGDLFKVGVSENPHGRASHMDTLYRRGAEVEMAVRIDRALSSEIEMSAHGILSEFHHCEFNGNAERPGRFGLEIFKCGILVVFDAVIRAVSGERAERTYVASFRDMLTEEITDLSGLVAGDLFYSKSWQFPNVCRLTGIAGKQYVVKSIVTGQERKLRDMLVIKVDARTIRPVKGFKESV